MIKIILADDHLMFRECLKDNLNSSFRIKVVGEASTINELVDKVFNLSCDVVVIDPAMNNEGGLRTLTHLTKQFPQLPMIVLSDHAEEHYGLRVMQSGAKSFVSKKSSLEVLKKAIEEVDQGKMFVSDNLGEILIGKVVNKSLPDVLWDKLTDREIEVCKLIVDGYNVSEISKELNLTKSTISTHKAKLLQKMKMKRVALLIRYVVEKQIF